MLLPNQVSCLFWGRTNLKSAFAGLLGQYHDPVYNCVDPILVILIQGIRHELFGAGLNIDAILRQAAMHHRKRLTWAHPDTAFCPSITASKGTMDWLAPAKINQATNSIKAMGLLVGHHDLVSHDIRRGRVRELVRVQHKLDGPA